MNWNKLTTIIQSVLVTCINLNLFDTFHIERDIVSAVTARNRLVLRRKAANVISRPKRLRL
jgi:hypothetical protein